MVGFPLARWTLVKRYSFIVADRSTGVVHRFALSVRPKLVLALLVALPLGWGAHAAWLDGSRFDPAEWLASPRWTMNDRLRSFNALLQTEVRQFSSDTIDLSRRVAALQAVVAALRDESVVTPGLGRAMAQLAEVDRSRTASTLRAVAQAAPTETLEVLHDLLDVLEMELAVATSVSDRIWPPRRRSTCRLPAASPPGTGTGAIRSPGSAPFTRRWTSRPDMDNRSGRRPTAGSRKPGETAISAR